MSNAMETLTRQSPQNESRSAPLLKISNLTIETRTDRPVRLVDGISCDIEAGEILALVGESGSGKSLTALSVLQLLPEALAIRGGDIQLDGESLFQLSESEMNQVRGRKVAMIFQEPQSALNPVQTLAEQIGEVLKRHRGLKGKALTKAVVSLLEEVGIPDPNQRLSWYPHQLSGGQKQRVMIAIALACEPDLLVADEPTTALDVTIQKQILSLLDQLRRSRRLAVLLITHDMGVVSEMADRVAVMRSGLIVESAHAETFFRSPQHEYSRQLIHSLPKREFLESSSSEASATHADSSLLSVRHLSIWFPQRQGVLQRVVGYTKAVEDVSFNIPRGKTLALVGESGSGKSTIGRGILGLEALTHGQVYFDGTRIDDLSAKGFLPFRKRIQVIFQDPFSSMNPRMNIRQILEEGMVSLGVSANAKEREQLLINLLEKVGLMADHLDRYPHEFSGGQRQRIAIARAIAVEPELIICDEPTSALDVSIRGQVIQLLKELQEELGLSYLFITHDLSIIPHLAHSVAVLKAGSLVEMGATEALMNQPEQAYTRELLAAAPVLASG